MGRKLWTMVIVMGLVTACASGRVAWRSQALGKVATTRTPATGAGCSRVDVPGAPLPCAGNKGALPVLALAVGIAAGTAGLIWLLSRVTKPRQERPLPIMVPAPAPEEQRP